MTWNDFLEKNVIKAGFTCAAITNVAGAEWASTEGFRVSSKEVQAVLDILTSFHEANAERAPMNLGDDTNDKYFDLESHVIDDLDVFQGVVENGFMIDGELFIPSKCEIDPLNSRKSDFSNAGAGLLTQKTSGSVGQSESKTDSDAQSVNTNEEVPEKRTVAKIKQKLFKSLSMRNPSMDATQASSSSVPTRSSSSASAVAWVDTLSSASTSSLPAAGSDDDGSKVQEANIRPSYIHGIQLQDPDRVIMVGRARTMALYDRSIL